LNFEENAVELVNVSYRPMADTRLFDDLSFSLPAGKTAVVEGATGSGKTAFIELLIGRKKPSAGDILVLNHRVHDTPEWSLKKMRRNIGGVGGVYDLIENRTVFENVSFPLIIAGRKSSAIRSAVKAVLDRFDLAGREKEKAGRLCRGDKVLVMLARAVVADQSLLLIDEPLAGLDTAAADRLNGHLRDLTDQSGKSIIITTALSAPDLPTAAAYTIREGKLK